MHLRFGCTATKTKTSSDARCVTEQVFWDRRCKEYHQDGAVHSGCCRIPTLSSLAHLATSFYLFYSLSSSEILL